MKVLILIALFITLGLSFRTNEQAAMQLQSKFQQLQQTSFGRLLAELVQLHTEIGGPVEELMNAVDEFLQELETKRQREMEAYEMLREEFLDLIQEFQVQIAHAKLDIATAVNKLEVVLKPRIEHLQEDIAHFEANMEENRETYNEEFAERDGKHKHYLKNKGEFERAIIILEECIELIHNLKYQEGSFVQMNKARRSIQQLKETIVGQDNTFAPIITALLTLAQNPSQSKEAFIEQVTELLNDCKSQVANALAQQTEQENKEQEDWEKRETFLNNEYNTFVSRKAECEEEIKVTEEKIKTETKFKADREADYQQLLIDLKRENEEFQHQTDIHNKCIIRIENDKNLTLTAKQVILEHADEINKFAGDKRKSIEWKDSKKAWD